jgi:hypothetical protein
MRPLRLLSGASAMLFSVLGCRAAPDATANGGTTLNSSDDQISANGPCLACLVGQDGACRPAYDSCARLPKCEHVAVCAWERGCLTIRDPKQRILCMTPCGELAGITKVVDPALLSALKMNACMLAACGSKCTTTFPSL